MKMLFIALSLFSLSAFADNHEGSFKEMKTKMIEKTDKHIAHLQETKACISAATANEQLKVCREKMKAHRQEMKKKWKERKDKKNQ